MALAVNHQSDGKRPVLDRFLGPGLLFLIVVLFYWKLVLTNQYTWLESPDLANMILPWFQFQAGQWHLGRFPLWDPSGWFGHPLFGQGEPGSAYPPNWLLFLVPLKHGWIRQAALHWYYVLIHYFAALTAYALARDLGRSRPASILAGCIYALGGYVASVTWPQHINGAVWTPLVFLYLFRAARRERPLASSLLSGFFLGFGWLAGHHQMNLLVSLAAAGLWIWLSLSSGKSEDGLKLKVDWFMARLGAGSMAIAILASGFQTIPLAEYGRLAVRWVGAPNDPLSFNQTVPYAMHEQYALKPIELLGIFIPSTPQGFNPYIGIVALSLGIIGVIAGWKERQVRWLAAVSLGGIFYSLGPNSLLHGVFYAVVPLVEKARVPSAGILLFALGLSPLVAYGVDLLPRPENFKWSRNASRVLIGVAILFALGSLVFFAASLPIAITQDRLMITAVGAALAAAVFTASRSGAISSLAQAAALTGLVLFELANVTNSNLPSRAIPAQNPFLRRLAEHSDLIGYIRNRGEAVRLAYDDKEIPYNIGDWYGVETSNAYYASVTENIWQMDVFSPRGQDFFGIKYYIGKTPPGPGFSGVFQGKSGLKVFENPAALPRVWSVHEIATVPDPASARSMMADEKFDPRRSAILIKEAAPELGACRTRSEDVQMPLHQPNYVRITADLQCRGMVILTDTWYPGWHATVDGKPARIYEAYGGVRGVVADAGRHTIEMRYRPASVILGGIMTVLAGLITLCVSLIRVN